MNNTILNIFSKATSLTNSRYVNTFIPVKPDLSEGGNNPASPEDFEIIKSLSDSAGYFEEIMQKLPVLKELNELLFIEILDRGGLKVTVNIENGKCIVAAGWDTTKKPSFVLPMYYKNVEHLKRMLEDRDISLEDAYRFTRVLFIPFLKGLYQADYNHLPKDKAYMQLDNFIQVEVKNDANVQVEGFSDHPRATVVNVDGQWLIFEGFQADPDVRYTMDIKQALEFAYLIRVKLIQAKQGTPWVELSHIVDKYNTLKKETLSYERKWHNVEETAK